MSRPQKPKNLKKWAGWLALSLAAVGCHQEDPDRLAKAGKKLVEKAKTILAKNCQDLWDRLPLAGKDSIANRVTSRLKWDKVLAGRTIEVHVTDGTVQLAGKVNSEGEHQRAVTLAQTTTGVEKVEDRLEVHTLDTP